MNEEIVELLKAIEHIDLDDFIAEGEKHPINRKVCPWCGGVKPDHFSYCRLKNCLNNLTKEEPVHIKKATSEAEYLKGIFLELKQIRLQTCNYYANGSSYDWYGELAKQMRSLSEWLILFMEEE